VARRKRGLGVQSDRKIRGRNRAEKRGEGERKVYVRTFC
jgi:hypothetical protein